MRQRCAGSHDKRDTLLHISADHKLVTHCAILTGPENCSYSRQASDHIPADAGFLCDKDAVLGVTTKGTPCFTYLPTINWSLIVPFLLDPKTKLISFEGRDPVTSKIVTDNKIIEKVNFFNYLGNLISY